MLDVRLVPDPRLWWTNPCQLTEELHPKALNLEQKPILQREWSLLPDILFWWVVRYCSAAKRQNHVHPAHDLSQVDSLLAIACQGVKPTHPLRKWRWTPTLSYPGQLLEKVPSSSGCYHSQRGRPPEFVAVQAAELKSISAGMHILSITPPSG